MKKKLKIFLIMSMMAAMILLPRAASAQSGELSQDAEEEICELLKHFDMVFGFACGSGVDFKFDKYTRTVMIFHSDLTTYETDTEKAKEAIRPLMKQYFGKKKAAFHPYSGRYYPDVSWLWTDDQGTLRYRMGDWGDVYPVGSVQSIIPEGKKRFTVTYQICWYHLEDDRIGDEMGVFEVTLKKKSDRYVIKNVVRTKTNNVFI